MQLTHIDRKVHVIQDVPAVHVLRRELREAPWVSYYNKDKNVWTFGVWAHKDKGLVREYGSVPELGAIDRTFILRMIRSAHNAANNPLTAKALIRAREAAHREELREAIDYNEAYQDQKKFIRNNARGVGGEAWTLQ